MARLVASTHPEKGEEGGEGDETGGEQGGDNGAAPRPLSHADGTAVISSALHADACACPSAMPPKAAWWWVDGLGPHTAFGSAGCTA